MAKKIAIKRITEAFRNQRDAKVASYMRRIACSSNSFKYQRTTREMFCLKILDKHKNITKLLNIFRCGIDSDIYMVFEHMEADLHAGWTFKVTNGNLFYITRKLKCVGQTS